MMQLGMAVGSSFVITIALGCTSGFQVPLVPERAQAITCFQPAADSELAALTSQPDSPSDLRLLSAGNLRFPRGRRTPGSSNWITVQYIVRPDGRVDPCTVRVLAYSDSEFIDPGVDMVIESTFTMPPRAVKLQQTITWQVGGS
jgi:hypothetical protein